MHQHKGETSLLHIFIDADSCPVKQEVYRVAGRYQLGVTLVANSRMQVPSDQRITLMVVQGGLDAADDWIVEHARTQDIVVTADVLLADRCLKKGALVVGPTGKPFTAQSIGSAVAVRNLMAELRSSGEITGGPPPLKKQDRSRFLHQLDAMIQSILRAHPGGDGSAISSAGVRFSGGLADSRASSAEE
ncbi:MAG: YaiI/YqxD family protein [Desulfovibrionales bacterium]|nr:MAG: YaiI/YqxD family protein [Desulfovibrionales bacterium]